MIRKTTKGTRAARATVSAADSASLHILQQQALGALQAGNRAYLIAVSGNDPAAESLLTQNHRLERLAARVEAQILEDIQAELLTLAASFQQQRGDLEAALVSLQQAVRRSEGAAQTAAWLDKINTLLLRVLA